MPGEYFQVTRVDLRGIAIKKSRDPLLSNRAALTDPEFDRLESLDLSTMDLVGLEPVDGPHLRFAVRSNHAAEHQRY